MASTSNHIACDLGASGGRVVLGSFDGEHLKLELLHRFDNGPLQLAGSLHWNAPGLLEQVKVGLARCATRSLDLAGIGIDTWGVDFGLLSQHGQLLGLPYHYRDARTSGMIEAALKIVPREEIYARTGIQFMELNTLYQLLALARFEPRVLEAADTLLFMPDLLNFWLSGIRQSEHSIAGTSQMFDGARCEWCADLLEALELPTRILPKVSAPAAVIGPFSAQVANEVGLPSVPVIAPAGHDTACAVAAVPAQGEDWAYISLGTWSLIGVELASPIRTAEALAASFTNESGIAGTTRFLRNVVGLWLIQECRRAWAANGREISYEALADMAADAQPHLCCIDADDPRFAHPGDIPARIQACCAETNQPIPQTEGEIARCVLESLALKHAVILAALERIVARRIKVIHIVGGGARNRLLCRLTADAAGKPVVAGPAEATAAGNVMIQSLACGEVSSVAQIRSVIRDSTELERYQPQHGPEWDEARIRFETLFDPIAS